jgi:hypothetical protein
MRADRTCTPITKAHLSLFTYPVQDSDFTEIATMGVERLRRTHLILFHRD